jgi:hypothetical protein
MRVNCDRNVEKIVLLLLFMSKDYYTGTKLFYSQSTPICHPTAAEAKRRFHENGVLRSKDVASLLYCACQCLMIEMSKWKGPLGYVEAFLWPSLPDRTTDRGSLHSSRLFEATSWGLYLSPGHFHAITHSFRLYQLSILAETYHDWPICLSRDHEQVMLHEETLWQQQNVFTVVFAPRRGGLFWSSWLSCWWISNTSHRFFVSLCLAIFSQLRFSISNLSGQAHSLPPQH